MPIVRVPGDNSQLIQLYQKCEFTLNQKMNKTFHSNEEYGAQIKDLIWMKLLKCQNYEKTM